jgi:methyl-accepting chemotaxis protein
MIMTQSDDANLQRLLAPQFDEGAKRIAEQTRQIEGLLQTPQAKSLYAKVSAQRKEYEAARDHVLDKKMMGETDQAMKVINDSMVPAIAGYESAIRALVDYYAGQMDKSAAAVAQDVVSGRNLFIAACVASVLLGILFSWLITASITGPIQEAVATARRVAQGDLTVRPQSTGRDETGQLLQALSEMTLNLRTLVSEVALGAHTVSDTSAQIAQGNLDLSQRTEEQASTLEETASSMEELTSTVTQNAHNARQASQLAVGASDVARKGGNVVGQVVTTMTGISDSSRKIADIIGVIDGIAFQTNILALNAAVEAARAGEQGRGFAVVAAEVRSLAQRSAAAAKEIKTLIGDSVSKVDAGTKLVDAAGKTMEEIVSSVKKVSDLIAEIAAASQEQSSGIEQVSLAVTQMDQVVQQNASLVEEATAATESMKEQAASLLQMVSRFELGAGTAAVAPLQQVSPPPAMSFMAAPQPIRVRPAVRQEPAYAAAIGAPP